ncbi:MAG: DUF192 domain-containing protein [Actinobacteria bacterium]|nr:DUF192 domain-containing protein [Actinomycetota bacterium]MCG2818665.1 DUF192 domain-containing protein [Actinomycetes bacterium]MBU4218145.1 DUF192 domain-containing protein [Actinomycetota bacterium]MBU4358570.1 DUF192 domain-containing protein [Actinomycetota bacterium]MBU4392113.1 DUF192 domain-containing protein [Actinomycetota bacterium]
MLCIRNDTRNALLASDAVLATTAGERRRGLIGRDDLEPGEALIIPRCRQVHTFGMRFTIDVLFVDGSGVVTRTCRGLAPRRVSPVSWRARQAIELPGGTLERTGTVKGDRVTLHDAQV